MIMAHTFRLCLFLSCNKVQKVQRGLINATVPYAESYRPAGSNPNSLRLRAEQTQVKLPHLSQGQHRESEMNAGNTAKANFSKKKNKKIISSIGKSINTLTVTLLSCQNEHLVPKKSDVCIHLFCFKLYKLF